jgi:O-antigen/teichoic acid export membrane protein
MKKINNLFLMTIANSSGSGITAIFWFIIAALLIPSEYGQIQYFISIAGLAYTISLVGTQSVITVYTAKKVELQSTLTIISLIIGAISGGVVLLLFSKIEVSFLVIAFVLNDIGLGYILGKKFFVSYSKYFLLQKSLTFLLGISFYFIFGPEGIIFGIVLSYIHFIIIILKILKRTKINFSLLKNKIGFVGNNYSINLIGIAKNNLDKIIIMPLVGFETLGNYALALQVFFVLTMFSKIIYNYTLPHDSTGDAKPKIKIFALAVAVIITILGVTIVPIIISSIFPDYMDSVIAIQIISLAVVPSTVTLMLSSKILGNENSKIILISRIVFASTIITLIVILTPIYGIAGTTLSFVVATTIQAIILFTYQKKSKISENRN